MWLVLNQLQVKNFPRGWIGNFATNVLELHLQGPFSQAISTLNLFILLQLLRSFCGNFHNFAFLLVRLCFAPQLLRIDLYKENTAAPAPFPEIYPAMV